MLFKAATLDAIAAGNVSLAFRKWKKPTVAAGGALRTRIGVLNIVSVEKIARSAITEADARKAGSSLSDLLAELNAREGDLYRIAFTRGGADPRIALRGEDKLSTADRADIAARLERFDRGSSFGPWTKDTLAAIAAEPGRRAPDLAARFGRDTVSFKRDVRKLKELGLTESLEVGYRLSPRGRAFLKSVR